MRETTITVFKSIYKSNDVPFHTTLEKVVERARRGKSKDVVDQIRYCVAKGIDHSDLKSNLPAIIFQGKFTQRNMNSCLEPSGLMIHDYDKIPDDEYSEIFNAICDNPHTVVAMRSPSGNGIKAVVRIPLTDKSDYKRYFDQFNEDFDYKYFDKQTSDFARACFETYDPDIYVNYQANVYSPVLIDKGYSSLDRIPVLSVTDDDEIINRIMNFNWGKMPIEGERNSYIFDISGAMCEYGVIQDRAEAYLTSKFEMKGFPSREISTAIKSAYQRRQFGTKYFEDYRKIDAVTKDISKPKEIVIEKYNLTDEQYDSLNKAANDSVFWETKVSKKGDSTISINPMGLKWFLERAGFRKYYPQGSIKPIFLKIDSYMVEETSVEKMKDFTLSFLMDSEEFQVWNHIATATKYFTETYMSMLSSIELKILRDSRTNCMIPFRNGILDVREDSVSLGDPIDIDCYVWKSQVIDHDFELVDDCTNDYSLFIENIAGDRPESLMSVIGYLCNTYKNKINNKAIILNDEVISDNPEGGTGKGLLIQGIRQVRSVAILDGKSFDDRKSFPYQTVSQDTNVLVFDDVKRNFDFESKFSLVTEGLTLERKNKDAVKLTVEESPKLVISTNYAIKGEGNSHERRRHEVEIKQHYNNIRTPHSEFKRHLFDDWEEHDFLLFYNYIVKCIQVYLKDGLVDQEAKNIRLRKFITESSYEFYEWITDEDNFKKNDRVEKKVAYDNFIMEYPDFRSWLKRKRFNIWIRKYCTFADLEYKEGNTQGIRWFMICTTEERVEKQEEEYAIDF